MATGRSFVIQGYKVRVQTEGLSDGRREARLLELDGGQLDDYEQHYPSRAVLSFRSDWSDWQDERVGFWSWSALALYGWFGLEEFDHWYDLVRSEQPLKIDFLHRDEQESNGHYVEEIRLGTSSEPLGEGPRDTSA